MAQLLQGFFETHVLCDWWSFLHISVAKARNVAPPIPLPIVLHFGSLDSMRCVILPRASVVSYVLSPSLGYQSRSSAPDCLIYLINIHKNLYTYTFPWCIWIEHVDNLRNVRALNAICILKISQLRQSEVCESEVFDPFPESVLSEAS